MLKIMTAKVDENVIISPDGEINTTTFRDFQKSIDDTKSNNIILDFEKVTYITSAGLGVLLELQQRIDANNGRLCLKNVNELVNEIFEETGFGDILIIN